MGMGDWLGTGTIASWLREYRSFSEARTFVHELEFKSGKEWKDYCKSGKKPDDIPKTPNIIYKDEGWKGMGDWLGTGTVVTRLKEYRSLSEARVFVHKLNLKSNFEWKDYCHSEKKPDDIPNSPHITYKNKGWKNWGDWLGTGTIAKGLREYRTFSEARAFVHELGFKSGKGWTEYCKSGKKPDDIPNVPNVTYKNNGWIGMGDWLGTGKISNRLREYRSFMEARAFVHELGLKGGKGWTDYCKSGKKSEDIPTKPNDTYKDRGWKNWGDWLGTGTIASWLREYRSFSEARAFVHELECEGLEGWENYCQSGNKPVDIPARPSQTYSDKGWMGMGDWLGTGRKANRLRDYRTFSEARAFVHDLALRNSKGWTAYCLSGKKPDDIPAKPNDLYKDKGWMGMGDWLGTGNISNRLREYRSFSEARAFVHELGFESSKGWTDYCKSGKKPDDIPAKPNETYKDKGWKGMGDWLGTGNISNRLREYRSFIEARAFVHELGFKIGEEWKEYCRSGKKPDDIPAKPDNTYKNKGWIGMGDWLGKVI